MQEEKEQNQRPTAELNPSVLTETISTQQSESTPPDPSQDSEPIDWGRLFRRKDRPLPRPGCSVAFFVFLALLTLWLIISYIKYKQL